MAGYFSGTITRSFVTGKVVSDAGKAGGLIGDTSGSVTTITQSYAAGNIESNGLTSQYTGGIVGHSSKTVNIENSFALGNITGNNYVGGLVGQVGIDSTLKTSYTVGEVKGNLNVGVLSGGSLSSSNITSCYNASQKELLIKKVNGFDYENIWDIEEGATYSYLREVDNPEQVKIGKEQYEGAGTEADPYIIENKEQLLGVKNNPGKHFAMINDIDLEMAAIEPLTGTVPFGGSFDGRDHVIKNVSVNGTGNVGLFGSCNNAVIKNLRVENIDVRGGSCIGSLIGEMEGGRVENCHISSGIVSGSTAGGLVGSNKGGDIADSSAAAEVYGGNYAGGLIGRNTLGGEITGSKSRGTINSSSSNYAGGLIGSISSSTSEESRISNSCASGTVGKSSGRYAGGLVGSVGGAGSTVIESSYADCEIGSSSCTQAGGLIGYNSSTGALAVENSFASGVILASSYAGGIIGYSATSGSREITNSYSLCQLSGNGSKNGIAPSTVSMVSSYFDLDKAGVSTPVEQAKTSSQLKTETTYENWDFINTWGIESGSYPYLRDVEGISGTTPAGQGTIEAPYIIENAEQLQGIRNNLTAHYRLGSDIDLENQHWQPVGENNNAFKGSLDGDGHKIKNLSIKNQSYAGLFAYGDGAVLKNITIENVNISEGKMSNAGGLIGYINNGQVEDCAVEGNIVIKSDTSSGTSYIGGMIGRSNSSTVKNNQVNGDLSIETNSNSAIRVGGMIGE